MIVSNPSDVSSWNTFFNLPTNGNTFTSVIISGNTVLLFGGSNIILKNSLFNANASLIKIIDNANCIIQGGTTSITSCSSLIEITLPALTSIGGYGFGYNQNLVTINLPLLTKCKYIWIICL
jgi:hypothetical protein